MSAAGTRDRIVLVKRPIVTDDGGASERTDQRVQCDEIWSFCYAKGRNVADAKAAPFDAGHVWTWTAIDPDSKLIISYMVGDRDAETAIYFMDERCDGRMQLTSDGHKPYLNAVAAVFPDEAVDYAMLVKLYGSEPGKGPDKNYSAGECRGIIKTPLVGSPDKEHVSTSYVERSNLTMRMSMRRFTRLTNALSKKIDNHIHAVALLRLVQLRPHTQDAQGLAGHGGRDLRSVVGYARYRGADGCAG
jgi:IS1 family transposase